MIQASATEITIDEVTLFEESPGQPPLVERLHAWLEHWSVSHLIADESGVGLGLVAYILLSLFGLPVMLIYGVVRGLRAVSDFEYEFQMTAMNEQLTPETKRELIDATPVRRIGMPRDVASLVSFLASDAAGFITGHLFTTANHGASNTATTQGVACSDFCRCIADIRWFSILGTGK